MPKAGRIFDCLDPQAVIDRFFNEDWFVVLGLDGLVALNEWLQSPCEENHSAGLAIPETVSEICSGTVG